MSNSPTICGCSEEVFDPCYGCNCGICAIIPFIGIPLLSIPMWIIGFINILINSIKKSNFYVGCIRIYQKYFSKALKTCCHFNPSCSEYSILAVEKYGIKTGIRMSIDRLKRCKFDVPLCCYDYP